MASMAFEICCNCGIEFGMPQAFQGACRGDSTKPFYCPNGHRMFYRESEADKLRRERDRLVQQNARLEEEAGALRRLREDADRRAAAARGQVTKLRKRVGNGVCPCCNRTFADLAAHMTTKHPDFRTEAAEDAASAVRH